MAAVLTCLWSIVLHGVSWASLVINEFLPDPAGSDGGQEFVELFNTGPEEVHLEGVSLRFANGSEGAFWATRWTGDGSLHLEPGGYFLIVDRNWMGSPVGDAEVYLGLQNGPDAVCLARGDTLLDLVGYGPLTDSGMMETEPADIASGRSLSRRPDGWDSGNNRTDFVLTEPTAGGPNFEEYSLTVVDWELDPPSVDRVFLTVRLTLGLRNDGTETFPVGSIILRMGDRDHLSHLDQLPPGQQRWVTWDMVPTRNGLLPLDLLVPLPAARDTLLLRTGSVQVGPGELVLSEVMSMPGNGQGEWVEVVSTSSSGIDLSGYSLRDEDGTWRSLPPLILEPGDFLVAAQDSAALAAWHRENEFQGAVTGCPAALALGRQRALPGWPSLNNTAPDDRDFADRVYLGGPSGDVIDHLTLGGAESLMGSPAVPGLSLERQSVGPRNPGASNWAPCTAPEGSTPGCSNSISVEGMPTSGFSVTPRILDPAAGVPVVHFMFTLKGDETGWGLRIFDLYGGLVRDFGGDNLGPGSRDLPWDGLTDAGLSPPCGGYIALLEIHDRFGSRLIREKALMVIR